MKEKSNRARLIGMIHAQKNAAGLGEAEYRVLVSGASGKESCADCTMRELYEVFNAMNRVLSDAGKDTFFFRRGNKPGLHGAVVARARKVLGEDYKSRLDSFIANKIKKESLSACSDKELRQVMGFISRMEKRP